MAAKTEQLQIRVTAEQKSAIRRLAGASGQDVSSYVLDRVLPSATRRWRELIETLADGDEDPRYVLAALNDLLSELGPAEFTDTVSIADLSGLSAYLQNHIAAMVELVADRYGLDAPAWTDAVDVLPQPHFATPLPGLRLYLLRSAPVVFKRRNIFVDSSVGDRV